MDQFDLGFDPEGVEHRHGVGIVPDRRTGLWCDHVEVGRGSLESTVAVDHDRTDGVIHDVSNGSDDQISLGVELAGRAHSVHSLLELTPESLEVGNIALEFGLGLVVSGGSQNEPETFGKVQLVEDLSHPVPLLVVDLPADADAVHARHHHHEAAGDREVAGDRRAFGSDALLEHLDQNLLALLQGVFNRRAISAGCLASDLFRLVATGEVPRVQVGDVEKSVHSLAVVDEGGLDRTLDVDHAGLVDVANRGAGLGAFDEEFLESTLFEHGNPTGLAGEFINEHQPGSERRSGSRRRDLDRSTIRSFPFSSAPGLLLGGRVRGVVFGGGFRIAFGVAFAGLSVVGCGFVGRIRGSLFLVAFAVAGAPAISAVSTASSSFSGSCVFVVARFRLGFGVLGSRRRLIGGEVFACILDRRVD